MVTKKIVKPETSFVSERSEDLIVGDKVTAKVGSLFNSHALDMVLKQRDKMTSHILILSDSKARRLSHKQSLQTLRPNSEFILVKSFSQALDVLAKQLISLIVLDFQVDDSPYHRTRSEAIAELKQKSHNTPIVLVGTEMSHAINSLKDGVDGFLPLHWLNNC